jgi:hypothetical protein
MTHLGSIEGHGRLIIEPGDEIGVHYQIDVFQAANDRKLAGGSLTGDLVALGRVPEPGKAVLELSDGHRVEVVIVETGRGTARIDVKDTIPGF